jgi:glycerol-3-phosphate acyltransferase PlsX
MRARIAVDAMGFDGESASAVRAACSLSLDTDIETILVGDEIHLQQLIGQQPYDPGRVTVRHASAWIEPDEAAAPAMRRKKRNSLALAGSMVGEGEADALVARGNREACQLVVQKYFRPLPGVPPAFGFAFSPQLASRSRDSVAVLLDTGGAESAGLPELKAYAVMGAAYIAELAAGARPRVGLVGEAMDAATSRLYCEGLSRVAAGTEGFEFVGEIGPSDLSCAEADVLVCSSQVGQSGARQLSALVTNTAADLGGDLEASQGRKRWERLRWKSRGATPRSVFDLGVFGGSPALGYSQVCLHVHQGSPEPALRHAIVQAARLVRGDLASSIRKAIAGIA